MSPLKKKVLLITEYLNPPYDEGIKKSVYNLFLDLDKNYSLKVICRYGFKKDNIHVVETNALYVSLGIRSIIKEFEPDSVIYLPFQSSTFASYLRLKVFSLYTKKYKVMLVALQPKPLKKWQRFLVRYLKPDIAYTPSPSLHEYWNTINLKNQLIPLLTDLSVFKPLPKNAVRGELRKKYRLKPDVFVISHMGHLNEGRNLKALIPLQKKGVQVVVVASSSTPEDAKGHNSLKNELLESGILILDGYIEKIHEVYQLSDLYVFPVMLKNSSIGMPLSILEARSCGIPVLTTNYGSINAFLGNDNGGITYADSDDFFNALKEFRALENINYQKSNVVELNNLFFEIIHNRIEK